ncbi:MAG: hypothetical protein QXX51_01360 [Candidatus Bathyarchaeia archaeon]
MTPPFRVRKLSTFTIDEGVQVRLDEFCKKYGFANKSRFVEFAVEFMMAFMEAALRGDVEVVQVSAKKE